MGFFSQHKTLIIGFILVAVVFVAYGIMKDDEPAVSSDEMMVTLVNPNGDLSGGDLSAAGISGSDPAAMFVQQLLAIQNIRFNTEFFSDPVYRELVDQSRPLGEREVGRPNPFLEIGNDLPSTGLPNQTVTGTGFVPTSGTGTTRTNTR